MKKLKITHINTLVDIGGAAKSTMRLAAAQRTLGHNVHILAGRPVENCEYAQRFDSLPISELRRRCAEKGELYYEYQGSHKLVNNEIIRSSDIVHCSNLHGDYFNPWSLSALSHIKPVVWTLRDMQSITGHCAHSFDCEKWQTGCGNCQGLGISPELAVDNTAGLISDKKYIYENSFLQIVTPADWLRKKVQKSILQTQPMEMIYNCCDTNTFKPYPRAEIRQKLGIRQDAFVIGVVAHGGVLANVWKGGKYTQFVWDSLKKNIPGSVFLNIGAESKTSDTSIVNVRPVRDETLLAQIYNAFDVFLYTSVADTCPLVVIEALSCGVPVVTFDTGGIPELVRNKTDGFVFRQGDTDALIYAVKALYDNRKIGRLMGQNARTGAVERFSIENTAGRYIDLYYRWIERHKTLVKNVKYFDMSRVPEIIKTPDFLIAEKSKEKTQAGHCDVSIVLCTMNRAELLDKMLASIPAAAAGIKYEIVAVAGQCADNTLEILKKHSVTKIYNELECIGDGKYSWPMLYNFAFSKASGKLAMFVSDDIIFGENCLSNAVAVLKGQPGNVAGGIFFYKNLHERPRPNPFDNNKFFVAMGYEFNILMNYGLLRLDYFRQVGGFDENYNFYYADSDLCNKLYSIGKILLPLPASLVAHNDILDNLKKYNFEKLEQDVAFYRDKWGKYYVDENNRPNRLVWQKELAADYIPQITGQTTLTAVNSYWQGLSFFQRNMYSQAKERFAEAINDGLSDPKVHDYLNKCDDGKNENKNICGIIFSKDRALQLDAAIRSFHHCCKDRIKLQVLYKASNQLYKSQYEKLKTRFNDVVFVEQGDFKNDVLRLLGGSEYVLFAVDDNMFVSDFSVGKIAEVLYAQNDCLGFSLRLGKNTTYCYSKNAPQKLPAFERIETGVLKYDWTEAQLDFNYPLEVSSSIYKVRDIMPLLEQLRFDNPNELEGLMALNAKIYIPAGKNLLCFEKSKTFCNPLNMVQTAIPNRASDRKDYSPPALAELFEKGMAIDIGRYFGFVPNACHQEAELYLKNSGCLSKTPVVSVEMVAYNAERYIAQAIESVLKQSFVDFELLIVDDGSDDKTERIVKSFSDARIKYIRQNHKGIAAGRNFAVTLAAGKYIVCVDSDDFIAADYLRNIFEYAENNPGFDYYYPAKLTLVNGDGGLIGGDWEYNNFPDSRILPAVLFANGFSPIPIVGSLITRVMFERIGLYEDCDIFEDFVFLCKNALKMKFNRFQSNPAYFYRRLPQSASQKSEIRDKTISNMLNRMIAMYPPEVICPQLVNISDPSTVKIQYYKYVSDIFYRHADGFHFVKFGQYFRRFGDFYKEKFLAAQNRLCVEPRSLAGRV